MNDCNDWTTLKNNRNLVSSGLMTISGIYTAGLVPRQMERTVDSKDIYLELSLIFLNLFS